MKALKKGVGFLLVVISASHGVWAQTPDTIDWKHDLDIYKTSLEQKHIDLYHTVSKDAFNSEWTDIYENLATLDDFEIIMKLMHLTRQIHDGHTSVSLRHLDTHRFPIEIKLIEGQWRIVKTLHENKTLLATTLESINGRPIDEVASKVSDLAQFVENEYSLTKRTGDYLPIAELLYHLKLIDAPDTATFGVRDSNNKLMDIALTAVADSIWADSNNLSKMLVTVPEIAVPKPDRPNLWFAPIANSHALYIDFKSYPTFEAMQGFGQQVVSYIQDHQIKQVIIDLRDNGGGDLYVGVVLAYALNLADSIDWNHGVFVMTSNKTFSAATSNAALFKQLLNARIVGQPTGSNPNGYQDMDTFTLPSSKLVITYSKRRFRLSNQINTALKPDITIHPKWEDWLNGTDTVLRDLIQREGLLNN